MPTGSSAGAITKRQSVSEKRSKTGPAVIESGKSSFPFTPVICLIAWGAINPTKPIVPPAQTAADVAKAPATITFIRKEFTFTPKVLAVASPEESKSSWGIEIIIKKSATKDGKKINLSSFQPRPLKDPSIQK